MDDKIKALHTLLELNHRITFYSIVYDEITPEQIQVARAAASVINETGVFSFPEDTSNIEFFKEIQSFVNTLSK